ncbi:MAG TPA: leucyl/phenylalanyl-tRNA--protein transferase [Roseiflexaceae bacterium]|nr:leucyl/phenylalanyl-tRNA--protein transferase [Roseiflexaceae bacterium]
MLLTPDILIAGYCQGYFPMAGDDGGIGWYDSNPRAIIPLDAFHVPRRLARRVRNGGLKIRVDHDFRAVMAACAEPREGQEGTWISPEMIDAYTALHRLGFAHSVETWREGRLVGGLYGVAIRGLFAGESMFSRETDASKVALVHLVERLRRGGFTLLDSQYIAVPHMLQFGTIEIPRAEYKRRLREALEVETTF